jgi:hypothetical protein
MITMSAHTVMTHALTQSDYAATPAPAGTPCGVSCATGRPAVHVVSGVALCGFHSPYDADSPRVAPAVSDAEWLATPSVLASGVSLVKAGDAVAPADRWALSPEWERNNRIRRVCAIGVWRSLSRNDLRGLSVALRAMRRMGA